MGGIFGQVGSLPGQGKCSRWRALAAGAAFLGSVAGWQGAALAGSDNSSDTYAADVQSLGLPTGTFIVLNYFGLQQNNSYVQNSNNIFSKQGITAKNIPADVTLYTDITRIVYFASLFGHPLVLEAAFDAVAVGDSKIGVPLSSKSGMGETVLFATYGVIVEPKNERFLGVTNYVILPTGVYDKFAGINPFTPNQYTDIPQIELAEGLGKYGLHKFWFDFIANASFHSDGDAPLAARLPIFGVQQYNKLTQDNSYDVKAFLQYEFAPVFWVAAGIEKSWGGTQTASGGGLQTLLGGPASLGKDDFTKGHVQLSMPVTRDFHMAVDFTHDFQVSGGLKEDFGAELRLTKLFLPAAPMEPLK